MFIKHGFLLTKSLLSEYLGTLLHLSCSKHIRYMDPLIDKVLADAGLVLNQLLCNPMLLKEFEAFAFTKERVQEGNKLYSQTYVHQQKIKSVIGDSIGGSCSLLKKLNKAKTPFFEHFYQAKKSFMPECSSWEELNLSAPRKPSISGWLVQSTMFYETLFSDDVKMLFMKEAGVGQEAMARVLSLLEELEKELLAFWDKFGLHRDFMKRDRSLDKLNLWLFNFEKLAYYIAAEKPHYLQLLGLSVKPSHYSITPEAISSSLK